MRLLAICTLFIFGLLSQAIAAARFWVEQPISGAVVSVASPPQIRLTVSSSTGMTTGDTVTVTSVVGTTEANGTWVITVIDGTHIDLQGTTFTNVYTSGGKINGRWNATNTNNWVTTSGGTNYGQTVPGSADTVTLDGNSGTGATVITVDVTLQQFTWGAYNGTFDNSANRNMTFSQAFTGSGTGTRTFTGGTGTYTMSGAGISFVMSTITGLTNPTTAFASSTLTYSGVSTSNTSSWNAGGLTYGTVNLNANKGIDIISGAFTIATLNVTGPNNIRFPQGVSVTITNAFTWTGTASAPIAITSNAQQSGQGVITTGSGTTNTAVWTVFDHMAFVPVGGSTLTATNSLDLGVNTGTGFTITAPTTGGSRCIGC